MAGYDCSGAQMSMNLTGRYLPKPHSDYAEGYVPRSALCKCGAEYQKNAPNHKRCSACQKAAAKVKAAKAEARRKARRAEK